MSLTDDQRFNLEILKLLLQIAWGDDHVADREKVVLHGLGRHWKLPEEELNQLNQLLSAGKGLPPPDIGLLKTQPERVLTAVHAIAQADGVVTDSEKETIQQVASMLGVLLR
jgi:uncharacterized tellurite resistance protein B-like protein